MRPRDGRGRYWQPGDPLSADDRALLAPLLARAHELGRTPARREVAGSEAIKRRFRTWGNAVRAADDRIPRHARGTTDHGGHADHEAPAH